MSRTAPCSLSHFANAPIVDEMLVAPAADADPVALRYRELLDTTDGLKAALPGDTCVGSLPRTAIWAFSQAVPDDGWVIGVPVGLVTYVRAFSGILLGDIIEPDESDRLSVSFKRSGATRVDATHPLAELIGMVHEVGWPDRGGWKRNLAHAVRIMHSLANEDALEFLLLHELHHATRRHTRPNEGETTVGQEAAYGHQMEFEADKLAFTQVMLRHRTRPELTYLGISLFFLALETYERLGGLGSRPAWTTHPPAASRMTRLRDTARDMARIEPAFATASELAESLMPIAHEYLRDLVPRSPIDDLVNQCVDTKGDVCNAERFASTCILWLTLGDEGRTLASLAETALLARDWNEDVHRSAEDRSFGRSLVAMIHGLADILRSDPILEPLAQRLTT